MKRINVRCPRCKNVYKTRKKLVTQCGVPGGGCGHSFDVKGNEVEQK